MRIIGGKDYYDSGLAYGRDDDVILVREKAKLLVVKDRILSTARNSFHILNARGDVVYNTHHGRKLLYVGDLNPNEVTNGYTIDDTTVYFCGKCYAGISVTRFGTSKGFWDNASFEAWLAKFDHTVVWHAHRSYMGNQPTSLGLSYISDATVAFLIENRISIATEATHDMQWRINKNGVVHGSGVCWRINGDDLKQVEFIRVFNPYAAYQELSMWVGSTLPREGNPIVEITDDKIKVAKHGFNLWSFRRQSKKSVD